LKRQTVNEIKNASLHKKRVIRAGSISKNVLRTSKHGIANLDRVRGQFFSFRGFEHVDEREIGPLSVEFQVDFHVVQQKARSFEKRDLKRSGILYMYRDNKIRIINILQSRNFEKFTLTRPLNWTHLEEAVNSWRL